MRNFVCIIMFIVLNLFQNFAYSQERIIDSLKLILKRTNHDTTTCNILNILAETAPEGEWEKYNEQLKVIAERNVNLTKSEDLKNIYFRHLANALNNFGLLYVSKGDIIKGLDSYHESIRIMERIKDNSGLATALINISAVYDEQGELSKSLEYLNKSLTLLNKIGDKYSLAYCLSSLGYFYERHGEPGCILNKEECSERSLQKALDYFNRSLKLHEEFKNENEIALGLDNIGYVYYRQEKFVNALKNFEKALKIQESVNDLEGISRTLNNISNLYYKDNKLELALVFSKRGLAIAKDLGNPDNIKYASQILGKVYKKQNKYKEALEMEELFIQMRDSISNESTRKLSIKKQFQIEYEREAIKDSITNIAKANETQLKNEAAITQQRTYTYGGFVGLALMLIVAGISFKAFKNKQKANIVITEQKMVVENQKHLIEEKQKEIIDSINYARRIQWAHLPNEKYITRKMNELKKV